MKGARQAGVVAETIIREQGVPQSFARAYGALSAWIETGGAASVEIQMATGE